jgi:hypothetical protein
VPDPLNLIKAQLVELKSDLSGVDPNGQSVTVQFNPDLLKVTFTNQIATGDNPGSQTGTPGQLHVGTGTTKMTLQLWFDATRLPDGATPVKDVRDLTTAVTYFITPKQQTQGAETKYIPPAVRFLWGSFHFDGIAESVEETLDYWSPDGKPLRATMSLSLTQQKIEAFQLGANTPGKAQQISSLLGQYGNATSGRPTGTTPMTQARAGATIQGLADVSGSTDWQSIASANGIENPRLLPPGQLVNLNPVSVSASVSVGL